MGCRRRGSPKKGGPYKGRQLIQFVLDAFAPLASLLAVARRLERHVEIVRHVARILDSDNSAAQVKRVLRRYLNRLQEEAPRRGRGAQTGHFVDHLVALADRYWSGLFHTYDHPEIPRTSNSIEGFFGSTKRSIRSITGRSSTAGGKMESCGEVTVRVHALTAILPRAELQQYLNDVSDTAFVAAMQRLVRIREPARERRSIQRNLTAYLDRTLAGWQRSRTDVPPACRSCSAWVAAKQLAPGTDVNR